MPGEYVNPFAGMTSAQTYNSGQFGPTAATLMQQRENDARMQPFQDMQQAAQMMDLRKKQMDQQEYESDDAKLMRKMELLKKKAEYDEFINMSPNRQKLKEQEARLGEGKTVFELADYAAKGRNIKTQEAQQFYSNMYDMDQQMEQAKTPEERKQIYEDGVDNFKNTHPDMPIPDSMRQYSEANAKKVRSGALAHIYSTEFQQKNALAATAPTITANAHIAGNKINAQSAMDVERERTRGAREITEMKEGNKDDQKRTRLEALVAQRMKNDPAAQGMSMEFLQTPPTKIDPKTGKEGPNPDFEKLMKRRAAMWKEAHDGVYNEDATSRDTRQRRPSAEANTPTAATPEEIAKLPKVTGLDDQAYIDMEPGTLFQWNGRQFRRKKD